MKKERPWAKGFHSGLLLSLFIVFCLSGHLRAEEKKPESVREKVQAETVASADEERPTGSLSVSVLSMYYSKGVESSRNGAVIQPSMTVGYQGFSANVWGNLDSGHYQTPDDKRKQATWTETDYSLSYSKSLGIVNLGGTYAYYGYSPAYEGATRSLDQQELIAFLGFNVLLAPTLTVYKLFENGRRWYFTLGVSHSFQFNSFLSLKLGATASYMVGEDAEFTSEAKFDDNANPTADRYNAFLDGVLNASLPIKATKYLTISPTVSFAFPLGTDARNYMKGNGLEQVTDNASRASSFVFGGIVLEFSF